jgi:hypothetical protein
MPDLRLGRKPGVVEDRRTFMAEAVLRPEDVRVPMTHEVTQSLHEVPMFANDRLGDCTQASKGHAIVTMERASRQHEVALTDEDVILAYRRVGGYVPGRPETDNGAYELDSLNDWRQNGIGREKDGTPHKIKAFVRVDHTDHDQLRMAHYVFGGLKVCAGLPLSAADQIDRGQAWDVTEGSRAAFGSWGGHSTFSYGYARWGLWVWTWGRPRDDLGLRRQVRGRGLRRDLRGLLLPLAAHAAGLRHRRAGPDAGGAVTDVRPCRHLWQPMADAERIWQRCVKCGEEQHVTTHAAALADSLAYILRDV